MTSRYLKASRLREAALLDIDDLFDHYFAETPHMVRKLEIAVLDARRHIERFPGTGSLRYELNNTEGTLRFWLLKRFPYAMFYIERADFIDIVRVLHQASNIPTHLQH